MKRQSDSCHDGDSAFTSDTRCATCYVGMQGYDHAHGSNKGAKKAH